MVCSKPHPDGSSWNIEPIYYTPMTLTLSKLFSFEICPRFRNLDYPGY
jgi:hypothetical protein